MVPTRGVSRGVGEDRGNFLRAVLAEPVGQTSLLSPPSTAALLVGPPFLPDCGTTAALDDAPLAARRPAPDGSGAPQPPGHGGQGPVSDDPAHPWTGSTMGAAA